MARTRAAERDVTLPALAGGCRGRYQPSDLDRQAVELMVGHGIPLHELRKVIVNPETGRAVSLATLKRHFAREIEAGRVKADAEVAESLFRQAIGRTKVIVDGEIVQEERLPVTSAAIWWTKARMGWTAGGEAEQDRKASRGAYGNAGDAAEPVGRVVVFLPENGRDAGAGGRDGFAGGGAVGDPAASGPAA